MEVMCDAPGCDIMACHSESSTVEVGILLTMQSNAQLSSRGTPSKATMSGSRRSKVYMS